MRTLRQLAGKRILVGWTFLSVATALRRTGMFIVRRRFSPAGCLTACCGLAVIFASATAYAQYPYGPQVGFGSQPRLGQGRPVYSPYLNLLRRGNSTLGNYYGLVRPELQFRAANTQFQSQFNNVDRRFSQVQGQFREGQMQVSGHRVQFLSNLRGQSGPLSRGPQIGRDGRPLPGFAPTGHSAVFGNNGGWFSGLGQAGQPGQRQSQ